MSNTGEPATDDPYATYEFGPDPSPARGVTLAAILKALGPTVLCPYFLPPSVDPVVTEPAIFDPGQTIQSQPGGILLAVGCPLDDDELPALIQDAANAGLSAVVVKSLGGDSPTARYAAEMSKVALLVTPDGLPWRQVDALLTAASSAGGQVHDAYASVGPGDLFDLANAIAFSVGGATTIEDTRGHVLAHSNLPHQEIDEVRRRGILGRQTPERPTNIEEYALVFKSEGPYRFYPEQPGYMNRLAMSVRAGPQLLGILWVLDGAPPLGTNAEAAIAEAAQVTALHLLRARRQGDSDTWQRGETLCGLLDGSVTAKVAAERIRLDYETPSTVVAIAQPKPTSTPGLEAARIVDLVNLYCEAWDPSASCATTGGVIYALLPSPPGEQTDKRLRRFGDDIAGVIERSTSRPVHVAIGPRADFLHDVPSSRKAADRVLLALRDGPHSRQVAGVHDVRNRAILLEIAEHEATMMRLENNPVSLIEQHDAQNSTSYALTILTYLDAFGDVGRAAEQLSIHENTLRYRLRRAQENFEIDLDDPDSRLVLWLQLKLGQLGR